MPHAAAAVILQWLHSDSESSLNTLHLTAQQVSELNLALKKDAGGIFYSAIISFLDALNGIKDGHFSWSTVKLYYISFYAARVILASNNIALFYVARNLSDFGKGYSIVAEHGARAKKAAGATHKAIWDLLGSELPSSKLLSTIGSEPAHKWFVSLREEVNYRTPRFLDPMVPEHFSFISRISINKSIYTYIEDSEFLYAFDPDHAALAFPVECLKQAKAALQSAGIVMEHASWEYLSKRLRELGMEHSHAERLLGAEPE